VPAAGIRKTGDIETAAGRQGFLYPYHKPTAIFNMPGLNKEPAKIFDE